jgi:hypothetical protein
LIATLAIGASWAPPGGTLQCDACRRDLIGNVICTKLAAVTKSATTHACCKTAKSAAESKPVAKQHEKAANSCPTQCAPCCLPQAHFPAAPGEFVSLLAPGEVVLELKPASSDAPSFGVHSSIFHPPRA